MTSTPMPTPSVEYGLLSPIFIVFGVAIVGVLVEAFLPRRYRYGTQVLLALGGLIAAFVAVVIVGRQLDPPGRSAVLNALAVDGPTLVLQGAILLVAVLAVVFFAERHRGDNPAAGPGTATAPARTSSGLDSFTPQASAVPDSAAEHEAERAGAAQTELFPLTMLAVGGMLVFPAANDLLTMFVALEVLSLPLYLLCGLVLRCCRSDCCSRSVPSPSIRGFPTSIKVRRPRSPGSWPQPPKSRRSARCCGSSTWRCLRCTTNGDRCCGPSRS